MDNLKGASKKSIYENKVHQLDNLGQNIDEYIRVEGLNVVEGCLARFVDRVHQNINDTPQMVTTGKINQMSIQGGDGVVNLYGNKWLIYQDRGVNGSQDKLYDTPHSYTDKMPPVDVFKEWIKEKNIRLSENHLKYGKNSPFQHLTEEQQINSVAWGMARNIYKHGFKPRNIFSKEIPQLINDLKEEISGFVVQSFIQVLNVKESAKRVIIP